MNAEPRPVAAEPAVTLGTSLRYLKGVGPERHKTLGRLGLETLEDLLYFFPRRYENRGPVKGVRELTPGEKECVQATVLSKGLIRTRYGHSIFRLVAADAGGSFTAVWFNQPYLAKVFLPKTRVLFYGKAETEGSRLKMTHPEYEILPPAGPFESIHGGRIVPIYPLTEDLSQKGLRQLAFHAREKHLGLLREFLPDPLRRRLGLPELADAVRQIHFPDSEASRHSAYRRLVFDEFFLMQLAIQMKKAALRRRDRGLSHTGGEAEVETLLASLDFRLTRGQAAAVRDALTDMKKDRPMHRLVQGDVGSGKTVVAAAALAFTAANGFQGALMAPTEVLAQQLFFNMTRFLEPLGIRGF
ncbi:MAG TPA: DEAD/DEAH box helicase, partial [Candidatus Eisenbacteria bacterium]|nr:DEAD/DEAH box helicase [Candidatus Eisenbacteria bacterium]